MKTKSFLIIALFFCLNTHVNAQIAYEELQSGLIDLTGWIKKLNSEIQSIFVKERKSRLVRKLGYLYIDLDQLAMDKQDLLNTAIHNHNNGNDTITLQDIEGYKASINTISKRLNGVVMDLNEQYRADGDSIVNKIRLNLISRKKFALNQIAEVISSENEFDKEKIKLSVNDAIFYINEAKQAVDKLRKELKEQ